MNIGIADAKRRLTELLECAEVGEEVVITRYGNPVVKLVTIEPEQRKEKSIVKGNKHEPLRSDC